METKSNTITTATAIATATVIVTDKSNKENIPPVCSNNSTTNKAKKKISIPHTTPSFKNNKKKGASATKRKTKRVPLADITNLINFNSATSSSTFTLSHQPQIGVVSDLLSDPSISSQKRVAVKPATIPSSKALRMGFR